MLFTHATSPCVGISYLVHHRLRLYGNQRHWHTIFGKQKAFEVNKYQDYLRFACWDCQRRRNTVVSFSEPRNPSDPIPCACSRQSPGLSVYFSLALPMATRSFYLCMCVPFCVAFYSCQLIGCLLWDVCYSCCDLCVIFEWFLLT